MSLVKITRASSTSEVSLTQFGLTLDLGTQDYQGYHISFSLQPYPQLGKQIAKNDYRLVPKVTR